MTWSKIEQPTTTDTTFIPDDALKQTYVSHHAARYKTNLLGIEENSHKKFKLIPVLGSIYSDKPNRQPLVADVQQGDLGNCAFLAMLRSIVRRYPHFISTIIRDLDEQYIEVKLFSSQEGEVKLIQYKLEKTIIAPVPSATTQFFGTMLSFFAHKLADKNEKNWVKLIEKAFVLHSMNNGYHLNLMNLQNHELNGKYPSYEDVVSVYGQRDVCKALLGCTVETMFLFGRCDNESKEKLKAELVSGELITVSFQQNRLGIETKHMYELVNIGQNKQGEFVILSNPWGFNQPLKFRGIAIPNTSSLEMLIEYPPNEMTDDQSIIIIPMQIFKATAEKCVMTTGVKSQNLIEEKPSNSETPQLV